MAVALRSALMRRASALVVRRQFGGAVSGAAQLAARRAPWASPAGRSRSLASTAGDDDDEDFFELPTDVRVVDVSTLGGIDLGEFDDDALDQMAAKAERQRRVAKGGLAGSGEVYEDDGGDMDKRIRGAEQDKSVGRVRGYDLHDYEKSPNGKSEPRQFTLDVGAKQCPGCGAKYQFQREDRSGFIPEERFKHFTGQLQNENAAEREVQLLLGEIQEQDLKQADFEVLGENPNQQVEDEPTLAELERGSKNKGDQMVCMRCHKLRFSSTPGELLRAGAENDDYTLTPAAFEELIRTEVRDKRGVVLLIVDIFDVEGSLRSWAQLGSLVGAKRDVIIAANKLDLLPTDISPTRVRQWVRDEAERHIPALRRQGIRMDDVYLVSCRTGLGVGALLASARNRASENRGNIYVVGAANVGKSSLINRAVGAWSPFAAGKGGGKALQKKGDRVWGVTASSTPGTTLGIIKVAVTPRRGSGEKPPALLDTPGLMSPYSAVANLRFNDAELKALLPGGKPISPVTLRVEVGKAVMVGCEVARVELAAAELGAFFFTFFLNNAVSLHPMDARNAIPEFGEKHVGEMLSPPFNVERLQYFRDKHPQVTHEFQIVGEGWDKSSHDVVLAGLGWFTITGSGPCTVRVVAPEGVFVALRSPLLPFEAKHSTAKFSGGRILKGNTGKRKASGKQR